MTLASAGADSGGISVVIPYFEDQEGLDAVLAGLRAQEPVQALEIVVADDGSARPPRVPAGVRVVRQDDRGFRAAAARNLGAGHCRGGILVFLDGDTVPEPGYLAAVEEALREHPHALVVGTRVHVDDTAQPPRGLGEPQWLARAWAQTDHLRRHDDSHFRYVISAVLSCRRSTFERLGGFDAAMVGYGGEDWELGWQAVLGGCELLHAPAARAVHRGADWGGRSEADPSAAVLQKNRESLRLASRITHPIARPSGMVHAVADIVVTWGDAAQREEHLRTGTAALAVRDLLGSGDVHVRLPGGSGDMAEELEEMLAADPRVQLGRPAPSVGGPGGAARVRPRFEVELVRACRIPPGGLQEACEQAAAHDAPALVVTGGGQVLARIHPVRVAARTALGLRGRDPGEAVGAEEQMLRLIRCWPLLQAGTRLEDVFRDDA